MLCKPERRTALWVGLGIIGAVLIADVVLVLLLHQATVGLGMFFMTFALLVSLPLLALLGYWLYGLLTMSYEMDRNKLVITWAATRQVIPMSSVQRVVRGEEVRGWLPLRCFRWPSYYIGAGEVKGLGFTLFYATRPRREQLFIVTPALTYAISPADREEFLKGLEARLRMGITQRVAQETHHPRFAGWFFWRDRLAHLLMALGLLANAALFAYVCARYPHLPPVLPLHFDAAGQVDRIGTRGEIFALPVIAAIILVSNLGAGLILYHRERLGSYLLWGGALVVQVLFWIAAVGLVG